MHGGLSKAWRIVCPSVKRVNFDKTKETSTEILIQYKRYTIHILFLIRKWLGDDPFHIKI